MAKIIITAPHIVENDGRLLRQFRAIKDAGHDVKFIAPSNGVENNKMVQYVRWQKKLVELLQTPFPTNIKRFISHKIKNHYWIEALKKENADLIITSEPEGLIVATVAKSKKTSVLYDCHEFYDDETEDPKRNAWAQKIHKNFINDVDGLITVSQGILDLYLEKYPNIKNYGIMINSSPFKKQTYDGRLHKKLGISIEKKLVVFHGNLRQGRGIERFPQIATLLPDDVYLVVIGNGSLKNFIENSVSEKLRYLPEVDYNEIENYLSGASLGLIFYVPSNLNQDWCAPNKLFELSNLGISILAYKTKSMIEFQKELPNINLIEPSFNNIQIAQIITQITKSNNNTMEMPKKYTLEHQNQALINMINSLI